MSTKFTERKKEPKKERNGYDDYPTNLFVQPYGCTSKHRFLACLQRLEENSIVLFLLKYIKKKEWKFRPDDIETAVSRYKCIVGG